MFFDRRISSILTGKITAKMFKIRATKLVKTCANQCLCECICLLVCACVSGDFGGVCESFWDKTPTS